MVVNESPNGGPINLDFSLTLLFPGNFYRILALFCFLDNFLLIFSRNLSFSS